MFSVETGRNEAEPIELRLRCYSDRNQHGDTPYSSKALRECYRQGAEAFGWKLGTALLVGAATAPHYGGYYGYGGFYGGPYDYGYYPDYAYDYGYAPGYAYYEEPYDYRYYAVGPYVSYRYSNYRRPHYRNRNYYVRTHSYRGGSYVRTYSRAGKSYARAAHEDGSANLRHVRNSTMHHQVRVRRHQR